MSAILRRSALACLIAIAGAASAYAAEPARTAETSLGKTLVDAKGMTLYTFAKDADGKSACVEKCATNWPPLAADAGAAASGDWTVIDRADGSKQWAYKGKPLYTFVKDAKAGEVAGEGFLNGAWRAAKP